MVAAAAAAPGPAETAGAAACTAGPHIEPLGPDLWWVAGAPGDAEAGNRGAVANLLLQREGARLWLLGSGPSPAFARALDCAAQQAIGLRVTDVISPRARAESVLGAGGLPRARHWAHSDVAAQMRRQCADCVQRLRQRLGPAAVDLGRAPVRLPERLLHGDSGQLGPWRWWRVPRAQGGTLTLWQARASGWIAAPGLAWPGDLPDLRDSDIASMRAATARLRALAPSDATMLLGEQGAPAAVRATADAHLHYWDVLVRAVAEGQARGEAGVLAPRDLPGIKPALAAGPRHALNWQRAWRQADDQALVVQPGALLPRQRSLR